MTGTVQGIDVTGASVANAESAASEPAFARIVEMPPGFSEELLQHNREFVETLRAALSPCRFRLDAVRNGVGINGDHAAILLASRVLEQIFGFSACPKGASAGRAGSGQE